MRQARPSLLPIQGKHETPLHVVALAPAGVSPRDPASKWLNCAAKRVLDTVGAFVLLVVALPLMLLIALQIRLDSPGPILFRQTRVGQYGRDFTFYKFRTMYDGADQEVHRKYIERLMRNQVPDCGTQGDGAAPRLYKLVDDRRVTRVGHLLRRASLDELPQLFNVLKGDMSLVGPRPGLPYEVSAYSEWQSARLAVLPGLTGWWQVRGRCQVTFDEMVRMDLEYIAHQSLWLDLKILALTIPAVVSGRGAA